MQIFYVSRVKMNAGIRLDASLRRVLSHEKNQAWISVLYAVVYCIYGLVVEFAKLPTVFIVVLLHSKLLPNAQNE